MIALAGAFTPESPPVMMGHIAQRHDISRKYLHALLTVLKQAGLVRSTRGAKGGYCLSRSPQEIKVSDIVNAPEGDFAVVECLADSALCARARDCRARVAWEGLNASIGALLERVPLGHLVGTNPLPLPLKAVK